MDAKLGYELPKNGEPPYPHRVHSTGLQFSLRVALKVNSRDIDHLCGGPMQGFKILFHAPYQNLNAAKRSFHLSPGQASYYKIVPNLIWTTRGAQKHSPDIRRCYLNSERRLRFFKFYSQRNCEVECLSNYTLAQCGCVLFSVPRTNTIHFQFSIPKFCRYKYFGSLSRVTWNKDLWTSKDELCSRGWWIIFEPRWPRCLQLSAIVHVTCIQCVSVYSWFWSCQYNFEIYFSKKFHLGEVMTISQVLHIWKPLLMGKHCFSPAQHLVVWLCRLKMICSSHRYDLQLLLHTLYLRNSVVCSISL